MRATSLLKTGLTAAAAVILWFSPPPGYGQASVYRGLWVGSASLNAVNEVSIPLDAANVPIAPNPEVPTPTFDQADLRLIIHVNGAGQASLLKDVAILNRLHGQSTNVTALLAGEDDVSLITDPMLYAMFSPQPAIRFASAGFDFGDAKATEALDATVEESAQQAVMFTTNPSLDVRTVGARVQARNDAIALIEPLLDTIVVNADVAEAFNQFLLQFDTAAITAIIDDTADPVVATLTSNAVQVRDQSFYGDTRALDMVQGVVVAVNSAMTNERSTAAHHTASAYADVANAYQEFISGSVFGDMIVAAADEAAVAAKLPGATAASIETALRGLPTSVLALTEALQARVQMYNDNRSTDAVVAVLAAMAERALANAALPTSDIRLQSEQAGRSALSDMVARYPLPVQTPTSDYNTFVVSSTFSGTPPDAAFAAADAAIEERAANPLYTQSSLYAAAKVAAVKALEPAFNAAARVMRTELPMAGEFALGSGDPRLIASLAQPSDLGPPGLEGRIYLPASYPTNPFRHRRHPNHTTGYNIERIIRLDFDGSQGDSLESANYGVERITGTYREEIFGLHKPLGLEPATHPIGLRTEGRFELSRISFIDTLNTD